MPEDAAIFQVSARDGLAAKLSGDRLSLERSGIKAIEDRLLRFLATEKSQWLQQSIARQDRGCPCPGDQSDRTPHAGLKHAAR